MKDKSRFYKKNYIYILLATNTIKMKRYKIYLRL